MIQCKGVTQINLYPSESKILCLSKHSSSISSELALNLMCDYY